MSPSKRTRNIKVHVPRHNSQRLGPAGTSHVEFLARRRRLRVDVRQTAYDPSDIMAQAIESASEWNSLLMTARAERGPQWDIGTQLFMVDERSDLFYDPSPLLEYQKEGQEEGDENGQSKDKDRLPIPMHEYNQGPGTPQSRRQIPLPAPGPNSMQFTPRHPGSYPQGIPLASMQAVSPAQFYGNGGGDPGMQSPMRMGGMGMQVDQMGGMGMGGMGGMGMASPDVRRRMTRGMGMGDDGFGGMH